MIYLYLFGQLINPDNWSTWTIGLPSILSFRLILWLIICQNQCWYRYFSYLLYDLISKHRYLCQIIVVAWIFLFEKFHFYFIWKNVQKWHKKSGKCFMKHFIFTSILPDDGEQHTNVDTNMEMENIWKSWMRTKTKNKKSFWRNINFKFPDDYLKYNRILKFVQKYIHS